MLDDRERIDVLEISIDKMVRPFDQNRAAQFVDEIPEWTRQMLCVLLIAIRTAAALKEMAEIDFLAETGADPVDFLLVQKKNVDGTPVRVLRRGRAGRFLSIAVAANPASAKGRWVGLNQHHLCSGLLLIEKIIGRMIFPHDRCGN
jgi:hypothetical protein